MMISLDQDAMQILYECAAEVDPGYISTLIGDFIEDALRMIAELDTAYAQKDIESVQRIAHTLKSQSATYGAMDFTATCLQLETLTRAGSLNGASELIAQIKHDYPEVQTALYAELARKR